ncbi:MAG: rhomboid family intramembrane serine protease [Deltaproteobacteria bacterium RIFCSPLOWO2_02_44_9]|nr:MAG: rhomboid family intramembrane serine protease [Deltaproteobacteria bacterium RIFCSPLOWO2_02_44_9]
MIPLKDDNPKSTFPFVTIFIITANILVYIYQLTLGTKTVESFILSAGAIPYEITHFVDTAPVDLIRPPLTLFSAMFIHGGLLHVAGNMLYLWIFGDNIEDRLGHVRFAVFYVLTGLIASIAHVITVPDSTIPMIGASGAVAGILGAYFLLYPRAHVLTLIFFFFFVDIVRIPALIFLGLWFVFQILSSGAGGGIAWYAHIGGFVGGVLLVKLFEKRRPKYRFKRS